MVVPYSASGLAQELARVVKQLGREGAFADPRGVGLEDGDDPVDAGRRHPRTGAGAGRGGAGGGDERVGAVVDVEQGRLTGLEQDRLALVERFVEQQPGVDDHGTQPVGVLLELVEHLVDLDRDGCRS